MDSIKPTPQNPYGAFAVKILQKLRNEALPTSESLLPRFKQFLTDLVLPESGIKEIENWTYGNYPFHSPPEGPPVQLKSNRKGSDVLDAVGLLPIGAAAKGGGALPASLIPVIRGANALHDKDLLTRAAIASQLAAKGKNADEIWNATKLHQTVLPGKDWSKEAYDSGRWQHELLPDAKNYFNPKLRMSTNNFYDMLKKQGVSHEEAVEIVGDVRMRPPNPGEYTLGDLIPDHPVIQDYPTFFSDVKAKVFPKNTKVNPLTRGQVLDGNISLFAPATKPDNAASKTFEHELQHVIQNTMGTPRGGSPSVMDLTLPKDGLSNALDSSYFLNGPEEQEARRMIQKLLQYNNHKRYTRIPGEQEANAVGARLLDPFQANLAPWQSFQAPELGMSPNAWLSMMDVGREAIGEKSDMSRGILMQDFLQKFIQNPSDPYSLFKP